MLLAYWQFPGDALSQTLRDTGNSLLQRNNRNAKYHHQTCCIKLGEDTKPGRSCRYTKKSRGVVRIPYRRLQNERQPKSIKGAIFEECCDEMIIVRDIDLFSLCEHHMLPFYGKAHVAYIPDGKIIGLSKIPRVIEVFARRLQVQERLTHQVSKALFDTLKPKGVGVVVEALHLCMAMRGVEKQNSTTTTSSMLGNFKKDHRTRQEFLSLIRG